MDELQGLPDWVRWAGFGGGALAAAVVGLWMFLSKFKVDRTVDGATVELIRQLQAQVVGERARADELMRDREAMAQEIGELRGEVHGLREQIAALMAMIEAAKGRG